MEKSKTQYDKIRLLTYTALFSALVFVGTMIHITPSANAGYTHFGDGIIYLASCILPAPYAMLSASIGAGLADIVAGSANWAVATIIIKALNVVPFALIRIYLKNKRKDDKILSWQTALMLIPSSLVTIFGYVAAESIMYGTKFAIVSAFISGWLQPLGSAVIFILLAAALDKVKFKTKILNTLKK